MAATTSMEFRQPPPQTNNNRHSATPPPPPSSGGGMSVASFGMFDNYKETAAAAPSNYNYTIPSEAELTLLCLDYLRDLVRSCPPKALLQKEGLNADWLLLAVYSLQQSFEDPSINNNNSSSSKSNSKNNRHGNHHHHEEEESKSNQNPEDEEEETTTTPNTNAIVGKSLKDAHDAWNPSTNNNLQQQENKVSPRRLPPLEEIKRQILEHPEQLAIQQNQQNQQNQALAESSSSSSPFDAPNNTTTTNNIDWYDAYDDAHSSNQHRLFAMNGLASRPLFLGELVTVACGSNNLRTRATAQDEMVRSPLFEQFFQAVESKGFFKNSGPELYKERYDKVVSKFRTKLASKSEGVVDRTQLLWERHQQRRRRVLTTVTATAAGEDNTDETTTNTTTVMNGGGGGGASTVITMDNGSAFPPPPASPHHNPADLEEAEALKTKGNAAMQKKKYADAAQAYTQALKLSPDGPNSHVYFSNRAAALLSQKEFRLAIADSERALRLKPNYGKAHARLGLAHFLLGDYRQAMEAYTVALKYEPDNKSSKSYLEKAAKRLAAATTTTNSNNNTNNAADGNGTTASTTNNGGGGSYSVSPDDHDGGMSFSVVSEWDKSKQKQQQQQHQSPEEATRDAEKYKVRGNQHMAVREYDAALRCYTHALELSPHGPQSHVYYSNRAAALCYLERYEDAARDSETAIDRVPTYGKAFARLGLSRFFLNDFHGAIDAYTNALKYDPDNAASKSYLAKAKLKLERETNNNNNNNNHHSRNNSLSSSSLSREKEADARRLMDDPAMQLMAKRAMDSKAPPTSVLMEDPEMQSIARKAMSDPTMMEAVMAVSKVQQQQQQQHKK